MHFLPLLCMPKSYIHFLLLMAFHKICLKPCVTFKTGWLSSDPRTAVACECNCLFYTSVSQPMCCWNWFTWCCYKIYAYIHFITPLKCHICFTNSCFCILHVFIQTFLVWSHLPNRGCSSEKSGNKFCTKHTEIGPHILRCHQTPCCDLHGAWSDWPLLYFH